MNETLSSVLESDSELDVSWIPITYGDEGGWVERVPGLSARHRGGLRAAAAVARHLRRNRYDAVLFNATWLAVMAAPWTGRAVTAIMADLTPRQYDREAGHFAGQVADGFGPLARSKHALNRRVLRSTSLHFPASEWMARSLMDDYGVDPLNVHVLPFGVDLALWHREPVDKSPLPQVLFVGGDFQRKGGDLLLDWFRKRGRGRCELTLVTADAAVRNLREPGVAVYSDLTPRSDQLRRLFWRSDVVCLPSRSEPYGIAAVEGLAAGLPVVTSDTGGLAEIVEHGTCGFCVPAGDEDSLGGALERLIESRELRLAMGIEARRRAEARFDAHANFSWMISLVKQRVDRLRGAESPRAEAVHRLSVDNDRAGRVL